MDLTAETSETYANLELEQLVETELSKQTYHHKPPSITQADIADSNTRTELSRPTGLELIHLTDLPVQTPFQRRAEESRGKQRKAIPGCRRENQRDAVVAAARKTVLQTLLLPLQERQNDDWVRKRVCVSKSERKEEGYLDAAIASAREIE
ncbi:hypothetical protein LOK49_LG01G04222 [Camellia lanceoleosa]|uniref:Uncharacterized protein n=1 Tax=Camellia lanceoleosa TaxID=1840588 RepID=A0ACC0J003_9ERIC|nr:hypothetical protein LOK49_LG01G04222 [Camellia lanceoleosa]